MTVFGFEFQKRSNFSSIFGFLLAPGAWPKPDPPKGPLFGDGTL